MTTRRDGFRLRREELGFTQEQVADQLGVGATTYRNWERGVTMPRAGFRPRIAGLFGVTIEEVTQWLGANGTGAPAGMPVPAWLGHLATLEQGASHILTYEPVVVPGLLQTEGYALAVERVGHAPEQVTRQRVQARIARQAVLYRDVNPLELFALLDESVLHRTAGNNDTMVEQLEHLATISLTCPTVEVRILPFGAGAFHAGWGSFMILTSPGSSMPYMASTVDGVGARYLDRPGEVEAHIEVFDQLAAVALPPDESRHRIAAVLEERYR